MDVLLIVPPYSGEDRYGKRLSKLGPVAEPLGLAYIAAVLEQAGHHVELVDAIALNLSADAVARKLEDHRYKLVGVTMLTPMYGRAVEVIRAIHRADPEVKIMVGGAHPTIMPLETLQEISEIDIVVTSEGEATMVELVSALEGGRPLAEIEGIAYREGEQPVLNPPRPYIKDLDSIPLPARHLLPMKRYNLTASRHKRLPSYTIIVARGCPFNCAFCSHQFGRTHRHHSPTRVIEEMVLLIGAYGAKEINLEADTLTLNRKFLVSLCEEIIRAGLNERVEWTCESRVDTVDKELLRLMKEAGCWQISYGVETGSQRLLDLIQKGTTLEQVEQAFRWTKELGINIRGFFMLGLPTETREESFQTIEFARKLDPDWAQFTVTVPFPGTELFEIASRDGSLRSVEWQRFRSWGGWVDEELPYVPEGRTSEELRELQRLAFRKFYLNPKVMGRRLRDITSFAALRKNVAGLWALIGTCLSEKSPGGR